NEILFFTSAAALLIMLCWILVVRFASKTVIDRRVLKNISRDSQEWERYDFLIFLRTPRNVLSFQGNTYLKAKFRFWLLFSLGLIGVCSLMWFVFLFLKK